MSTDKSHAHDSDHDAELPIEDLSAKPVDEKSAEETRGGDGTRANFTEIVITKVVDKATP